MGAALFVVLGIGVVGALLQCPSGSGGFGSCLPGLAPSPRDAAPAADNLPKVAALAESPTPGSAASPPLRRKSGWVDALIAGSFDKLPAEPGRSRPPAIDADAGATGSATARPATAPVPQAPPPTLVAARTANAPKRQESLPAEAYLVAAVERLDARIDAWQQAEAAKAAGSVEVAPVPAPRRPNAAKADTRIVGGSGVTVRSGPSTSNKRLFALASGEKVTVVGRTRGWLQVIDGRGRSGWAYSRYLRNPGG